ncbi:MAG: hypothetical protein HQM13_17785 [SAR324 cluster bacterium]|nr:hypothetical protein [SAR324 cluster bacterium]
MSFFDSVVEQKVRCKVPGCGKSWILDPKEIVENWKHNNYNVPKRMCGSCSQAYQKLSIQKIQCSTKFCEELIRIPPFQQLVAEKKNRPIKKQNLFCAKCQTRLKNIEDKKIPCRIKACTKSWTWFASSQLKNGGMLLEAKPDFRLCGTCFKIFQTLTSQHRPCRVSTCNRTWELDRMTQLESQIKGKKSEPKRMCSFCNSQFRKMVPKKEKCQISGCNKTWEWSPYGQLEYEREKENNSSLLPPRRYCTSCFSLKKTLKPSSTSCIKNNCPQTNEYSIEDQLEDILEKNPISLRRKMCTTCEKFYNHLKDEEISCQQKGCDLTWLWKKEEQFRESFYQEGKLIRSEAPTHYCNRCDDFLHNRSDTHVQCQSCESLILWTSRQQLMTELNLWVPPRLCPSCLKKN